MNAREASEAIRAGALALDVREQVEWDAGRIAGALHVPLNELGLRYEELPRGRRIVCVCRSGGRSGMATQALARAGLDIENLDGGMKGWLAAGLPIEPAGGHVA